MDDKAIDSIKKGDKLIFVSQGQVLSANVGYVYTFSNWYEDESYYFQCEELHKQGNHGHNFHIGHTEIFDNKKHKDYTIVTSDVLNNNHNEFVKRYGA